MWGIVGNVFLHIEMWQIFAVKSVHLRTFWAGFRHASATYGAGKWGGGWIPLTEYFNVGYSLVEIAFPMNEKFWSEVGYFRILNLDIFVENG